MDDDDIPQVEAIDGVGVDYLAWTRETLLGHDRRMRDLERKVDQLERNLMSEQEQVNALATAVAQVATDLATAQTTLQTELDALAAANPGVDLSKLTTAVDALDPAVQALAALKPAPAQPTAKEETVTIPIDAAGEGSVHLADPLSRVTIATQPTTGTASLSEDASVTPTGTLLTVTGATPETQESVTVSIAAA